MAKKKEPKLQQEAFAKILADARAAGLWAVELINDEPTYEIILDDVPEDFFGGQVGLKLEFLPAPTKKDPNPEPDAVLLTVLGNDALWGTSERVFANESVKDFSDMAVHLLLRLQDLALETRPKQVWIRTGHWGGRQFPADAPCKYLGRLTDIGSVGLFREFSMFNGANWEDAQRVSPPKTFKFEVEVDLESCTAEEAKNFVEDQLDHKDLHRLSVKLV